ncbi:MAG: hypothetical protein V4702_02600 [Patescibacteria group bacterium]
MQNKNQSIISLRQRWFLRIQLIAASLSLFVVISSRAIPFIFSGVCDNVQGWDGLGCSLYGLYIGRVIAGVSLIVLSIALLKRFVIDSRHVATLITIPLVAFIAAAVFSNGLDYVSPDFPYDLTGYVLLFILGTIFISVLVLLAILFFSYTNKISRTAGYVACILLVPTIYNLTQFVSTSFRSSQLIQEQKEELSNLSFKVYQPTYIPSGYYLSTGLAGPGLRPGGLIYTEKGERELPISSYYNFWYKSTFTYGGDSRQPENFQLYEYEASTDYNPPRDCGGTMTIIQTAGRTAGGADTYGDKDHPCELVGKAVSGCDVYYEEYSWKEGTFENTSLYGYCKLGSTVTVITADNRHAKKQNVPQKAEMIKIFDSLKELTQQQLENYASEDSKN